MKILTETNFSRLKEQIKKAKIDGEIIAFTSTDDELNRKVLEKLEINLLIISLKNRKDFSKQRNAGFNQVMVKIANKKNIQIGINLDELIEEKNTKLKSELIGRICQNIFLCKKNKVQMQFISPSQKNFRNIYDLKSLGLVLGMDTKMTKELR